MQYQTRRILITVKAYPNPSRKYGETVCCAGIDVSDFRLVRLYPVPFRDLENEQKFKKYSIIMVNCATPQDDHRAESLRIDADSISVIESIGTEKGTWKKRKEIVFKVPVKSLCQIQSEGVSLGLIKPKNIDFEWKKASLSDQKSREACYAQLSLFNKYKVPIEKTPLNFYYKFECANVNKCPGHKLPIIDWELREAYRDWRAKYLDEKLLLEKIEQKWRSIADTTKRDAYFYVGNMKRFPDKFMVLGVFWPPNR